MKLLKIIFAAAASVAAAAPVVIANPAPDFLGGISAAAPLHPELYSFMDVYRLTVAGAAMANYPVVEGPIRVAVSQPQPAAEIQFSIRSVPEPERWLLLLSGLAAAGWVARRRLGYAS
jgi:PEP-CTERM motif-containing protein